MDAENDIRRYALTVVDRAAALEQIAGTLRRRGHAIRSLTLEAAAGKLTLTVGVVPRAGRADRVAPELAKLHGVLSVVPIP